jgi:hypothetical protein
LVQWKAALDRQFQITTGIKRNRWLRISCEITPDTPKGWKWQKLDDYAASLPESAYQECSSPRDPQKKVWVHVVDTRVRKLYRCQMIIVRKNLTDPISRARFWVTSDLTVDAQTCINVINIRWEIEVFFEDIKELLGIDRYQLMSSRALLRYWTLCLVSFSFLDDTKNMPKQIKVCKEQIDHQTEILDENGKDLDNYQKEQHVTLGQALRYV